MRDHYHQLFTGYLLDKIHYLHGRDRVERARRLVRQQYLRLVDKRPSNGNSLTLPSGKLIRLFVVKPFQPHLVQRLPCPARTLLPAHARNSQRQLHIALYRLLRYQIVTLKYKTDPFVAISIPIAVAVLLGGHAVNAHLPRRIVIQPAYNIQKRGLSAPRRSQHGHKFTTFEIYIYPFERQHPAVARLVKLFYTFQSEHFPASESFLRRPRINMSILYARVRATVNAPPLYST